MTISGKTNLITEILAAAVWLIGCRSAINCHLMAVYNRNTHT